jgi:hypothetical protein
VSFIDDLYLESVVAHDSELLRGTIADRVAGDVGTITGTVSQAKTDGRRGLEFQSTGLLTYADSAARRLAGGQASIVVLGKPVRQTATAQRLVSKRDAGGTSYDLYTSAAGTVTLYDGANARTLAATLIRRNVFAVTLVNGAAAQGYIDGVALGAFSGVSTIAADDSPLRIGNYYDSTLPFQGAISRVLLLSRALTAREVSVLYEELVAQKSVLRTFGPVLPQAMVADAVPLSYDMTVRTAAGLVPNLGTLGSTYDATVVPPANATPMGLALAKESGLTVTAGMTPITSDDTHAVEFICKIDSITNAPVIVSSATAGAYWIGKTAADVWEWRCGGSTRSFTGRSLSQWVHIVANKSAAGDNAQFYCNGVALATAGGSLGNKAADVTALVFGRYMSAGQGCLGKGRALQLHATSVTQDKALANYRKAARTPYHVFDVDAVPVTLANVTTAGAGIPTTPVRVGSGQWAVKDRLFTKSGERKREAWIENVAAGWVSRQQDPGTRRWRFRVYRANTANTITVGFLSSARSLTFDGYALQFLTDGGSTRIFVNSVAAGAHTTRAVGDANALALNTWYDIDVSLRFDGLISVWYRKTGSKTWIVGPSATNTSYTRGAWQVMDIDAADRLGGPCAEWLWSWSGSPEE